MADAALAELTQTVTALPYEEQQVLLESLSVSIRRQKAPPEKKQMNREDIEAFLDSFSGRVHSWDGEDALSYQQRLREDRDIG